MSEKSIVFAVARIRSIENNLLNRSHYEQILSADTEREVFDILSSHGYYISEDAKSVSEVLDCNKKLDYELISELAGDREEIKIFTIKNDYHNLKTAIKSHFCGGISDSNMMYPASVDTQTVKTAVSEKKYDLLPGLLSKAAEEAYDTLVLTNDGQLADIIIDRYTLLEYAGLYKNTNSELVKEYCALTVAVADIKTAVRGAKTGKGDDFYEKALCGTDFLEKRAIVRAARKGENEVISYINSTAYSSAAEFLKSSVYELEKWYDRQTLEIMQKAMYVNFEIEPLIAYGLKRENEIKNLRIAATCKNMGIAAAAMERMCISDV